MSHTHTHSAGVHLPADSVPTLTKSFSSSQRDYPKSLSQSLQDRGLSVEMLYLQAESGLTRALQDVRADGSPFCILVEQTNIALSSCTVIIFSESLKSKSLPRILLRLSQTKRSIHPSAVSVASTGLPNKHVHSSTSSPKKSRHKANPPGRVPASHSRVETRSASASTVARSTDAAPRAHTHTCPVGLNHSLQHSVQNTTPVPATR